MNKAQELTQSVTDSAQAKASGLFDLISENPLPAALIGVGVGLLAAGGATAVSSDTGSRGDTTGASAGTSRYISGYSEDVSHMYGSDLIGAKSLPKPDASQHYDASRGQSSYAQGERGSSPERMRQAKRGLAAWVDEQPLAVGALSLLIGAAIGFSVPGSQLEDEVMGERSDALIGEAKSAVGDVAEIAKETVSQAQSSAQEEWSKRSPSADEARANAKETVKSTASSLTTEVKEAAKKVVDDVKETAKAEADKRGLTKESSS